MLRRPSPQTYYSQKREKVDAAEIAFGRRKVTPKQPGATLAAWDGYITGGVVDKRALEVDVDVGPDSRRLHSSGLVNALTLNLTLTLT